MKNKYLFFIIFFLIGIPNYFVKYDTTGLTHYQSFDINHINRIIIYIFLLYCIIILTLKKKIISKPYIFTIKIPILYYLLYAILIIFGKHIEVIKAYYRIIEWVSLFLLIYYIQLLQNKLFLLDDYIKLTKILVWYSIILIFTGLLFRRNMTYVYSMTYNFYRLGGYLIGPNSLGVIMGLGIAYYLFFGKNISKFMIIILFLSIMILTYSRGAILGFLFSFLIVFSLKKRHKKFLIYFAPFFFIIFFKFTTIINFLSRGEGIQNLLTLSERFYVFLAALSLIKNNFFSGVGFVTGTRVISNIMKNKLNIEYWSNVHAHNEFLQALASGGIIMFLFDIYIFIKIFKKIRKIKNEKYRLFFYFTYLQLIIFSFLMVTLSFPVSIFNGLIWLLYIAIENSKLQYV